MEVSIRRSLTVLKETIKNVIYEVSTWMKSEYTKVHHFIITNYTCKKPISPSSASFSSSNNCLM